VVSACSPKGGACYGSRKEECSREHSEPAQCLSHSARGVAGEVQEAPAGWEEGMWPRPVCECLLMCV